MEEFSNPSTRKEGVSMVEHGKTFAVGEWLKEKFAGMEVIETFDAKTLSQLYLIRQGTEVRHRMLVHEDFLDDNGVAEIRERLDGWHVDGLIRKAGLKRVRVMSAGARIDGAD
jgi:hypothetical protein